MLVDEEAGEALVEDTAADGGEGLDESPQELEAQPDSEMQDEGFEGEPEFDYKGAYEDLKSQVGKQGNELGDLRRENQSYAEKLQQYEPQAQKADPWVDNPQLQNLKPEEKTLLQEAFNAHLQSLGVAPDQLQYNLQQLQTQVQQTQQYQNEVELKREVADLQQKVGTETFEKYRQDMWNYYDKNPQATHSIEDVFKIVAFDGQTTGKTLESKEVKQQRKQAASLGTQTRKTGAPRKDEVFKEILEASNGGKNLAALLHASNELRNS